METEYYKVNFIASSEKIIKVREQQTSQYEDFVKSLKSIEDGFNNPLSKKGLSEYHINATTIVLHMKINIF